MLRVLATIKSYAGVSELTNMQQILEWIEEADGNTRREAWCSDFMMDMLREAGIDITGVTPAAASWLDWGVDIGDQAVGGCIAVFHWSSGPDEGGHHVTMVDDNQDGVADGLIACWGGNQGRAVKRCLFSLSDVQSFRMPEGYQV
jgi:uncharacterized protein (TIGR02594 family)